MSAPAPRLRALVVDDEPIARRTLRQLLERDPDVTVAGECPSGRAAVQALRQGPVDVLLVDVEMPGMSGLDVVRAAGPGAAAAVVFVTAHETYALDAFEVGAVHYLLKPFDDARFAAVLARAKAHASGRHLQALAQRLGGVPGAAPPHLERLVVRDAGRITLVPVRDVDWVEAADCYVELHVGPRTHLLRGSLSDLEARLDPRRFARIHRSTLVNVERVQELHPLFHGEYLVVLEGGPRLKLSRTYRDRLGPLLAGAAGGGVPG